MAQIKAKRRPKGEGTLSFNEKKGKWTARITVRKADGTTCRRTFEGKTKAEAQKKRNEWMLAHDMGDRVEGKQERTVLAVYIMHWMQDVKKGTIKAGSYERSLSDVKKHIIPNIGLYRLAELTPDVIQQKVVNPMRAQDYAYSTIVKPYNVLNDCLKYAVSVGDLLSNPCTQVVLPKNKKADAREIRSLRDEEVVAFLKECDTTNPKHKTDYGWLFKLILYTGLREGEACALRPEDINLREKYIHVHATIVNATDPLTGEKKGGFTYQNRTKTNRSRNIYFNEKVKIMLRERMESCPAGCYLANKATKAPNLAYIGRQYKTVCRRAGIEDARGLHDLRHTYATKLVRAGVDVKTVSEQLGHSTVAFTLKTYVHPLDSEKSAQMEALSW